MVILFLVILLMTIDGYFIGGYWCLLMAIDSLLMVISGYYINGYW
jgi:hypothetical protein